MKALEKADATRTGEGNLALAPRERFEVHEGPEAIDRLGAAWDELADRVAASAWLRPGWVRAWWRAFGRGRLQLFVLWRDGRLAGVVPMERRGGDLRSTTNYHTPSFGLLAEDDAARSSLATSLVRTAPRRLTLKFLPECEPSLAALEAASREARRPRLVRVLERCPYLSLEGGTWADLLSSRGGNLRHGLPRRLRRLSARGRVEVDVWNGGGDLDRRLEEGLVVEASGWKGQRGTAIASTPATREFYAEIARWLAARGVMRLGFLRLDGQAIAFDFCIEEGSRHLVLKSGYDEAYRADAPGVLLRASMIERAFERRLRRYDFLGKDDPWKTAWTSTVEVQVQFQAFRRSPAAVLDWAAQQYLRPIARRVLRRA